MLESLLSGVQLFMAHLIRLLLFPNVHALFIYMYILSGADQSFHRGDIIKRRQLGDKGVGNGG